MGKQLQTMKDNSPLPNPDPQTFHGKWTDWSDEHDQKSLKKKGIYKLRHKSVVPEGGEPFYVEQSHPEDGGEPRLTQEIPRLFHGDYLLSTCWNWELTFKAVTP